MRSPRPPVGAPEIYAGIVGRVVETYRPYTEASDEAIATQFVVAFGNAVGRGPHVFLGETRHGANEFLVVCGRTSVGRKGDAGKVALAPYEPVDQEWVQASGPGLSSGEGLITCVRDPIIKVKESGPRAGEEITVDPGVTDKRFLAYETEFSAVLKQFAREGNTLSNVLREAWDGRYVLRTRTRNAPLVATGAHISLIGHSTPDDLRRYLSDLDIANGTANRCVYVYVERARELPNPRRAPEHARTRISNELRSLLERVRGVECVQFAPDTEAGIAAVYASLSAHRPGLLGMLLERAPAHVRRLALIYALLEASEVVHPKHLESALAFWELSEASAKTIFAGRSGQGTLDRILLELLPGQTMTLEAIRREIFAGHVSGAKLRDALTLGVELGDLELGELAGEGRTAGTVTRSRSDTMYVGASEPVGAERGAA